MSLKSQEKPNQHYLWLLLSPLSSQLETMVILVLKHSSYIQRPSRRNTPSMTDTGVKRSQIPMSALCAEPLLTTTVEELKFCGTLNAL